MDANKKPEWSWFRCEVCQSWDLGYDIDPPPQCTHGHGPMKFIRTTADAREANRREMAEAAEDRRSSALTVGQLIALLQQCDLTAKVVWEHDGMEKSPTGVQRCQDGQVELLTDGRMRLAELRDYGQDVVWPE